MNRNGVCPTAPTFRDHFGHITEAYRLIGYKQVHAYRYSKISGNMRHVHRTTLSQLISAIKRNVVAFDEKRQVLKINDSMTVAVFVLPYLKRNPLPGWKLYFERVKACDAIFLVRMEKTNTYPLDFHLLPRNLFREPTYRFTEDRIKQLSPYRLRSLSGFERAVVRIGAKLQTGQGNDSANHTADNKMGLSTHRGPKKSTARPAAKSEDFLMEQLVAREAHKTGTLALMIPKEVVDMMVDGSHPIRAFRVHRRMTQLQLCAAAKIMQKQLSDFEKGRVVPKAPTLKRLALALNVPQDLLTPIK